MTAHGARRGNLVYHWKHGWIPLDHFAALSKAHHSRTGAVKVMQKRGIDVHDAYKGTGHHGAPKVAAGAPSEVSAPGSWTTRPRPDGSFAVHGKDGTELGRVRLVAAGKHKGQWEGRLDGRHGADHAASPKKTIDAMYDSVNGPGAATQARAGGSPEERRLAAYKAAIRQHQASTPTHSAGVDPHAARAAQLRDLATKKRAEADRIANGVGAPDRAGAMLRAKDSQRMNQRMDSGLRRFTEAQRQAKALESKAHLAEGRSKTSAEKRAASTLALNASKVSPGDMIAHKGSAHMVTKVNRTTVSVPSIVGGPWEDKLPLGQVSKHVKVADMKESTLRTLMSRAKGNHALQAIYAAELKRRGLAA